MLIEEPPELDRTFAALADPTRREILGALAGGEAAAGKLAERFPIFGLAAWLLLIAAIVLAWIRPATLSVAPRLSVTE
jgi:hypothetical protein